MLNQSNAVSTRSLRGWASALVVALVTLTLYSLPAKATSNPAAITINDSICDLSTAGYLGAGSVNNPWQISDSASLWETTDCEAQNPGGHFILIRDISVANSPTYRRAIGYVSFGNINKFQGTFDGQGYSINNLNVEGAYSALLPAQAVASAGLFAWLNNAVVRNIALSGVVAGATGSIAFEDEEFSSGTLAARATGNLVLANLTVSATVSGILRVGGLVGVVEVVSASGLAVMGRVSGRIGVGGFVGQVSQSANISQGTNEAFVESVVDTAVLSIGGIFGYAERADLHQIENRGQVRGVSETGGLIGNGGTVTVSSSINFGEVIGGISQSGVVGFQVAGLVGIAGEVRIFQSANRANVSVWGSTGGGLIGQATLASIEQSENSGAIILRDGNVGGLVGRANILEIQNSINVGRLVANTFLGGLAARAFNSAVIENSYNFGSLSQSPQWSSSGWLSTSPITSVDGILAVGNPITSSTYTIPPSSKVRTSTVLELRMRSTFVGWDFDTVWGFNCSESIATPKLRALSGSVALVSNSCPIAIANPSPPTPPSPPLPPSLNETPAGAGSSSSSASTGSGSTGNGSSSNDRTPVLLGNYTTSPGLLLTLNGDSFDLVNRVLIGTISATISFSSLTAIKLLVPLSVALGKHDLTLESNSGRHLKINALIVQALPSVTKSALIGKSFALPGFTGMQKALSATQRKFVNKLLARSEVQRVVCTGLISPNMTHHARVQVRLRAIAACQQVRSELPRSGVWVQNRTTGQSKMLGRVLLTIRG